MSMDMSFKRFGKSRENKYLPRIIRFREIFGCR